MNVSNVVMLVIIRILGTETQEGREKITEVLMTGEIYKVGTIQD